MLEYLCHSCVRYRTEYEMKYVSVFCPKCRGRRLFEYESTTMQLVLNPFRGIKYLLHSLLLKIKGALIQ